MRLAVFILLAVSLATTDYSVLKGRLAFATPSDWREVRRVDGDSITFVAFVVPRPAGDSPAPAGNIMVDAALSHRKWDLKTYSDAKLSQEASGAGHPAIVDDKTWTEESSRTVLSTSQLRSTPYAVWDKFAVRDTIYLDIRTAIPVAYAADSAWEAHYEAELGGMLKSFRVGREPVFQPAR